MYAKIWSWLRSNLLLFLIMIGVILGFFVGIMVNPHVQKSTKPSPRELAMFIFFPGEIFLRMLQLMVLPLIVSSVAASLAFLDKRAVAKLGKRAAVYFFVTTLLAVVIAVSAASFIIKSDVSELRQSETSDNSLNAVHAILDMIRNIFPDNIVQACFSSVATKHKKNAISFKFVNASRSQLNSANNISKFLKNKVINPWSIRRTSVQVIQEDVVHDFDGLENYNSANILGVLVFSVIVGIILSILDEDGKPMKELFGCLFKVMMKMIDMFMWFSPIGIMSIIAGELAAMDGIKDSVASLGLVVITVVGVSLIHGSIILPIIYFLFLRKNPFTFFGRMSQALVTAFGTGSSSSTIPVALYCLEIKQKVDPRVSQFVLPVGTTISKCGSGIYIAVATIYISQTQHGSSMTFVSACLVCLASTIGSVAAAPIPGASPIATKTIALQAIGIRSADIALILAIDWMLTRIETPLNVWGNCIATVIIEHLSRDDLRVFDEEKEKRRSEPPVKYDGDKVQVEINHAVEPDEDGGERNENT